MIVRCPHDKMVKLSALKPHPKNRNKHPDDQVKRLADILNYQGWRYPVKVSKRSGLVTSGHGRIAAARANGWTHAPVSFQEYDTDEQEYADVQADNAIASWAELDLSGIHTDVTDLGPDFDLDMLGIKDFVLEPAEMVPMADDDAVPEFVEPRTKLGDVYTLGSHRLMCGDSTSIDAVDVLMNSQKADMVFTDPPYGMSLNADFSSAKSSLKMLKDKGLKGGNKYANVIGDHEDFSPELINTVFANFSYCPEVFMWGADHYAEHLVDKNEGSWIVWDKRLDESADKMYGSGFELCWSKSKHKRDIARVKWAGVFGTEKEFDKKRHHPTQKPILLAEWFFERWGSAEDKVADLFGGSGSTLIACEKTNRKCFMMELDPHYCDVIVTRWENYTGKKAVLLNGPPQD